MESWSRDELWILNVEGLFFPRMRKQEVILLSGFPSFPSAVICCFFSSLKILFTHALRVLAYSCCRAEYRASSSGVRYIHPQKRSLRSFGTITYFVQEWSMSPRLGRRYSSTRPETHRRILRPAWIAHYQITDRRLTKNEEQVSPILSRFTIAYGWPSQFNYEVYSGNLQELNR